MENLIDSQHGPTVLIASLILALSLHLILKLIKFVYELFKEKAHLKEKNIDNLVMMLSGAMESLIRIESRLSSMETQVKIYASHSEKNEGTTRQIFSALKKLSGKNWPKVRQHIMDDEIK